MAVHADDIKDDDPKGVWSLTIENDSVAGTDRDYTNGGLISYVGPQNDLPLVGRFARDNLQWLSDAKIWRITYGLGQNMFTPKDITTDPPDPDDRPYAGFLYGSVGIVADKRKPNGDPIHMDALVLDVGIVGPASLAEGAQKAVHFLINDDKPRGWNSQLGTEVAFRLVYERNWRALARINLEPFNLQADVTPHLGLALGTLQTYASAGAMFRIGDQIADDYGPPRIRPGLGGVGFFEGVEGFSWQLFAGFETRLVARDLMVEGSTFEDSPGVNLEREQIDFQAGFAIQYQDVEIAFTHILRSPELVDRRRWNRFGSINIRTRF